MNTSTSTTATPATTHIPAVSRLSLALFTASGLLALMLAMGIGRFAYTALLPQMIEEGLLTHSGGALLAGANYVGYLAGALWAAFSRSANPVRRLAGGLAASVATTLAMGFDIGFTFWCIVRFAAGIASAVVYVYATGIVLRRLMAVGAPGWSTLHFVGVGGGITVSALIAQAISSSRRPSGCRSSCSTRASSRWPMPRCGCCTCR
ncbi:MAG: YbfB/YjiJ family MFS transporter [Oxalobacteraceae bacterium]